MTITQARALSLELSRAILAHELVENNDRPGHVRLAAQWRDVPVNQIEPEPRAPDSSAW